jgi:hypothetical protein
MTTLVLLCALVAGQPGRPHDMLGPSPVDIPVPKPACECAKGELEALTLTIGEIKDWMKKVDARLQAPAPTPTPKRRLVEVQGYPGTHWATQNADGSWSVVIGGVTLKVEDVPTAPAAYSAPQYRAPQR